MYEISMMTKEDIIKIREKYWILDTFHFHVLGLEDQVTFGPTQSLGYIWGRSSGWSLVSPPWLFPEYPWFVLSGSCITCSELYPHSCFFCYSLSFSLNSTTNIIIQDLFHAKKAFQVEGLVVHRAPAIGKPSSAISLHTSLEKLVFLVTYDQV